jgi:hypothetical protein
MYRTRQRAARLAQIQQTTRQDNLPERGNKLADNANRDGGAERCPDPAVQKCRAVDLALLGSDDPLRSDLELHLVNAAQRHDAHTLSLLQTVPGMGKILRLVRRSASHELQRFPSVQDCLADGRLVTWAQDSAGQREGTAGAKRGHASLQWAVSPAAGLCRRDHSAGHTYVTKRANQHGQGNA